MSTVEKVLAVTADEERRIKATYDRSEEELVSDVKILKEWMKKQPHLPQDEDKHRIKMMLIKNNCSLEMTKKKLDMFYSIKHFLPEFYDFWHPLHPVISLQMDNGIFMPLPKLTPDCHRVYLFNFTANADNKFIINSFIKLALIAEDLRLMCDPVLGEQYICDFKHGKLEQFVQFTPSIIKKAYTVEEKVYSDQIKGFHFINLPTGAGAVVKLITSILQEKEANRVKIHKDYESLHEAISKEVLPAEYGGTAGTVDQLYGNWRKYVESKNDWIKELCEKKSDESKRVGEPLDSDMFGMCVPFSKVLET